MIEHDLYAKLLREKEIERRFFREHAIEIGLFRSRPWTDGDVIARRIAEDAERRAA